jgi:hypothetical protein
MCTFATVVESGGRKEGKQNHKTSTMHDPKILE